MLIATLLEACSASDSPESAEKRQDLRGRSESEDIAAQPASMQTQLERAAEVNAHLRHTYFSRLEVQATTQGPNGEVVDWIDPRRLDPDYDSRTPPPESAARPAPEEDPATDGFEIADESPPEAAPGYDLQAAWEKARSDAPTGMVPVVRPNFDHYISGQSGKRTLKEFLDSVAKPTPTDPAQPQPAGQLRLYTSRAHTHDSRGTQGWLQYVNPAQVPSSGAFSLTQLASLCWGSGSGSSTLEAIEVGFQKYPEKYSDNALHFFTFFRTNGSATGNYLGGYNLEQSGFVPSSGAFPPGAIIPDPPAGQVHQRRIRTILWDNAWWVQDWVSSSSNTWLGYYPIGTGSGQIPFDLIDDKACQTHWYGEVYDKTPTNWHNGDLGNGVYGTQAGSLAFMDLIIDTSSGSVHFNGVGTTTDPACYDMTAMLWNSSANQNYFRFGGPGGDAAGCN